MRSVFSFSSVAVIDCGFARTSLGVFTWGRQRLRCTHFAEVPFPIGLTGDDRWLENTAAALVALKVGRRRLERAVLVLPAHLTLAKQIKVPQVEPAKREKIIRFEAGQAIPHPLSEVVWDFLVSGRREGAEDVLLVAARRDIVDRLCAAVTAAGFVPGRIVPSSLATLAAFRLSRPDYGRPALVLNLGERSTILFQVEGTRLATRTLASGSSFADAESSRVPEFDRLFQEVRRSVLHFERLGGMKNPECVFLTGSGVREPDLAGTLSARLKIPVEELDLGGAIEDGGANVAGPAAVDLIGAALIALRPVQAEMDLLPPALRQRENLRRRQPWLIVTAIAAAAALVPPIMHYRQLASVARAKAVALEETLAPLRARESRNRANLARLEQVRTELARFEAVEEGRLRWLRLFVGLQERLVAVEDVWLEKLQWVEPVEGVPMRLAVSGCMLAPAGPETPRRVADLLAGMAKLPAVTAAANERYDVSVPGLLRFDLELVIDPARPL